MRPLLAARILRNSYTTWCACVRWRCCCNISATMCVWQNRSTFPKREWFSDSVRGDRIHMKAHTPPPPPHSATRRDFIIHPCERKRSRRFSQQKHFFGDGPSVCPCQRRSSCARWGLSGAVVDCRFCVQRTTDLVTVPIHHTARVIGEKYGVDQGISHLHAVNGARGNTICLTRFFQLHLRTKCFAERPNKRELIQFNLFFTLC